MLPGPVHWLKVFLVYLRVIYFLVIHQSFLRNLLIKHRGNRGEAYKCSPCIFMILGTQIFNVACTHHLSMIIRSEGGTLGLILGVSRPQGPQDQMGTSALPSALRSSLSPLSHSVCSHEIYFPSMYTLQRPSLPVSCLLCAPPPHHVRAAPSTPLCPAKHPRHLYTL